MDEIFLSLKAGKDFNVIGKSLVKTHGITLMLTCQYSG